MKADNVFKRQPLHIQRGQSNVKMQEEGEEDGMQVVRGREKKMLKKKKKKADEEQSKPTKMKTMVYNKKNQKRNAKDESIPFSSFFCLSLSLKMGTTGYSNLVSNSR